METKHVIWTLIIIAATLGVIGYFQMGDDGHSHGEDRAEVYTCPMHPSVRSDRPGACPVCGMALVRRSDGGVPEIDAEILGAISLSPTQRVVANISTVPVRRGTIVTEINAVGLVAPAEPKKATVAARFRGRIEKLYADVTGEQVMKGEPLFELYSPDLISAQREFLLALSHAGSGNPLVATVSMQEQLLAAAREKLIVHYGLSTEQVLRLEESRELHSTVLFNAPISGTVLEKSVVEGDYVEEGMSLYRLADLSRVWVMLDVYESDLDVVRNGQEVVITSEAYPGKEFRGRVTFIDPVLEAATRTVKVRT
ncbi:MAG: efflux RND transporter periplasmic adaptor subunit, partial [Ignavibacteria bacterium]|nr:efflux RND transporter periplasmic adaptor subunit [Ignavibacteria bacterium]